MSEIGFLGDLDSKLPADQGLRKVLPANAPDAQIAGRSFRLRRGEPFTRILRRLERQASERTSSAGANEVALEDLRPEAVIDVANFLPSIFLEIGAARARAVCRISVTSGVTWDGQRGAWGGTGFLVAPGVLLTNHHVINSISVAREAVASFGYRRDDRGRIQAPEAFKLRPDDLFVTSPFKGGLDYTFIAVDRAASDRFGYIKLDRRVLAVEMESPANIIQHPDGRPQELVLQQNYVRRDTGTLLYYDTDTQAGSSGSPVFDNAWELIALHHASRARSVIEREKPAGRAIPAGPGSVATEGRKLINEGIKISAIAADLDRLAEGGDEHARRVLGAVGNIDSGLGFFGALGRAGVATSGDGPERVVQLYKGTDLDLDIGFWNIEWFSNRFETKVDDVAAAIADMNLDLWGLSESSPQAVKLLVRRLKELYGLDYGMAHSEPNAGTDKQSTSVIWNKASVKGARVEWPAVVLPWFKVDSRNFDDLELEAVHGKVFDRYPGRFIMKAKLGGKAFAFNLVPLHLKAMAEGSLRREQASLILAAAVAKVAKEEDDEGHGLPWIIGGDLNAEIASGDFAALDDAGLTALTAGDEADGAFSYISAPYRSMIDHIYVSADVVPLLDPDRLFIVAADKRIPDYVKKLSDHRPIVTRLVARPGGAEAEPASDAGESLRSALSALSRSKARRAQRPEHRRSPQAAAILRTVGGRITLDEMQQLLADPSTREEDLRPFVRVDPERSNAFSPVVTLDPSRVKVEHPEIQPESAFLLNVLNNWSRGVRARRYREKLASGYRGLRFVSEGDSWFQYPVLLDDVVDQLSNSFAVFSLDAGGDELGNMVQEMEYLPAIRAEKPDGFLLSAGGNDLLGEDRDGKRRLAGFLHSHQPGRPARDYLNPSFFAQLQLILAGFRDIFGRLQSTVPDLPIFVHTYDYAVPGSGGPWLRQPMRDLRIDDPALQRDIVRALVDEFTQQLKITATPFPQVILIDARGTVGESWHNELHPTDQGFKRVAEVFRAAIAARFPDGAPPR